MALLGSEIKPKVVKAALNTLYYPGIHRLLQPWWQGVGAIFTLHHVSPAPSSTEFAPNRILNVTPEFLDQTLNLMKSLDYDIVSLAEVKRRLEERDFSRRFVSFTLDDGYKDNYDIAYPVFTRHGVPFTVYVATSFPDGAAILWWELLEKVIEGTDELAIALDGKSTVYRTARIEEKYRAWDILYRQLRAMPEVEQRAWVAELALLHGIDPVDYCRTAAMSWDELRTLSLDPLVTIGAHTINHFALRKLDDETLASEVNGSRDRLAEMLGEVPRHFSYPYGNAPSASEREFEHVRELGFDTATTMRKAVLFPEHAAHLSALPRISLNGDYQSDHYTKLFLSGAPFALSNRFQKIIKS